jgi:zinc/manganese transport system substrate-binding protein
MRLLGLTAAFVAVFALNASLPARAADQKIAIVAAENFYGSVAQEIGGDNVAVTSIMSNPDQDPHLFEVSPTVVRQIAAARLVVYNGADYDPWIEKLLQAAPKTGRVVINAAELVHRKAGDNPHIWYDPATMPAVARKLASDLAAIDPAHKADYAARLKAFLASLAPIDEKIAAIRAKFAGMSVTATEPVFGDMARALGLTVRNQSFQLAIMNDTEPSAGDLAAFERDLQMGTVRILFYNTQASDKLVQHLVDRARALHIPVVGVTETAPPDMSYRDWMLHELDQTEHALSSAPS